LFQDQIYFNAQQDLVGTELYFIGDGVPQLAQDIYRGQQSGRPTDVTVVDDKYLLIAENINYGREIFSLTNGTNCATFQNIVYCNQNELCDLNVTNNTIFVGDIITVGVSIIVNSTVEGSIISQGGILTLSSTKVLGSLVMNQGTLVVTSGSSISVRGCITPQNTSLMVNISTLNLKSKSASLLNGQCIIGNFSSVVVNSPDPCTVVKVQSATYNNGLQLTFVNTNICNNKKSLLLEIILSIVGVIVLATLIVLIILLVKPIRKLVAPYRDRRSTMRKRTEYQEKAEPNIRKRQGSSHA